jgi:hypothetical protein
VLATIDPWEAHYDVASDKARYVAPGLALLNEVRTCCCVREGRCRKKGWFLETMSRPLRLQSSPVRVLSRNVLPDGQSDIDFYHKFFDTCCLAEGRRCALSKKQTVLLQISPWSASRACAGHVSFAPFSVPLYLNTIGNRP